jgi:hypothetical protein
MGITPMTATRIVLSLALVMLTACDTEPQRDDSAVVSATLAANDGGLGMVFPRDPPAGTSPEPNNDCKGAYEWARRNGAFVETNARLRVTFRAKRYLQLDLLSISVRVVERADFPGFSSRFWCDMPGNPPADDPDVLDVEIPSGRTGVEVADLPFMGPFEFVGLATGEESTFLLDVSVPHNGPLTRFEVVLNAQVNGVARTYVLRDGDKPFTLLPDHGGAGFSPAFYYWCPGSPGQLVHQPPDDPLDGEPPPGPPC